MRYEIEEDALFMLLKHSYVIKMLEDNGMRKQLDEVFKALDDSCSELMEDIHNQVRKGKFPYIRVVKAKDLKDKADC